MTTSIKDSQISVRISSGLKEQMETYAQLTGRSKSHVAMEALADYLAWRIPQIEDLKEAIAAADRGDFASDADVAALFDRYADRPAAPAAGTKPASAGRRSARAKRA